jgi:hypothetical protein
MTCPWCDEAMELDGSVAADELRCDGCATAWLVDARDETETALPLAA